MNFIVSNILVPLKKIPKAEENIDEKLNFFIAKHCKMEQNDIISYTILNKSLDARKQHNIKLIYKVNVYVKKHLHLDCGELPDERTPLLNVYYKTEEVNKKIQNPVVVGTGPAGLLAAFLLAKSGMKPIILERGEKVESRIKDIDDFLETRELNESSNYLYGEGGAGAFSDGKLYTRKKDYRIKYILELLVEAGAPEEIKYLAHPHIGSDLLPTVIKNIREKIEDMGGSFKWNCEVVQLIVEKNNCVGVICANGDKIEAPKIIIAHGHSARDLTENLVKDGVRYEMKDFQIGCRIEHKQAFINKIRYGTMDIPKHLSTASYNVVSRPQSKKYGNVTSFCMCPGGEIIPAVCDKGQLSTNGMSPYARDTEFANSALIANYKGNEFIEPKDAFEFLKNLEKAAFELGGGDYTAPAQSAYSFFTGEDYMHTTDTSYRLGVTPAQIDSLLPEFTRDSMKEALKHFETTMPGFMHSGMMVGVETKVSSPVRFTRDKITLESSLKNLYVSGEGAGYASGIISAAIDGLRIAEKIIRLK